MTLKDRIKEAMESAGLKHAELARATGKTNAAVTQWLDGSTKSLKADTATRLELATGFSAEWLVSGKGPKKRQAQDGVGSVLHAITDDEWRFLEDFRRLTDHDRARYASEISARATELREYVEKFINPIKNGQTAGRKP
jgi:transcriptional regulator with XRE-family HTH domain